MPTPRFEGLITTRSPICIGGTTETIRIADGVTMDIPRVKALPVFHQEQIAYVKALPGESIRGHLAHLLTLLIAKQQGGLTAAQLRCLRGSQIRSKKDKKPRRQKGAQASTAQTPPAESTEDVEESKLAITPALLRAIAHHPVFGNFGTVIAKEAMEEGAAIIHHAVPHTPDLSYWHPSVASAFAAQSVPSLTPYVSPQSAGKLLPLSELVTVYRARRTIMQRAYISQLDPAAFDALNEEVQDEREKNQRKQAGGAADVMRRYWEVIPAHLPFAHVIAYKPWVTDVDIRINGILLALDAWRQHPIIGGLSGIGQGQVTLDYDFIDQTGTRIPLFRTAPDGTITVSEQGQGLIDHARAWLASRSTQDLFPMLPTDDAA